MLFRYKTLYQSTLLLLLTCSSLAGQDTIFVVFAPSNDQPMIDARVDTHLVNSISDRDLIYGSVKLPGSNGQQSALNSGLRLSGFKGTDCGDLQDTAGDKPFLVTTLLTKNQLVLEIQVTDNCCYNFLGDVEVTDADSNLNLKYIPYGAAACSCTCCFGLTYTFEVWEWFPSSLKTVSVNGKRLGTLQPR